MKDSERANWGISQYRKRMRQAQHKIAEHMKECDAANAAFIKFTAEVCGTATYVLNGDMYTKLIEWVRRDGRLAEFAELLEATHKLGERTEAFHLEGQRAAFELFPCRVVQKAHAIISRMGESDDIATKLVAEVARCTLIRLHNEAEAKALDEVKAALAADSN